MATTRPYGYDSHFDEFVSRPAIGFEKYDELSEKAKANTNNIKLLDDLQANILKHHKKTYSAYLMISFKNESSSHVWQARNWIAQFGSKLTSARVQLRQEQGAYLKSTVAENEDQAIRCFYLSHKGYVFLGASHFRPLTCASFRKGFRDQISGSFHHDIEDAYAFNDEDDIDAMAMIATNDLALLSQEVNEVVESVGKFAHVHYEIGFMKKDGKSEKQNKFVEWFGYVDGFAGARYFPDTNPDFKEANSKVFTNVPSLEKLIIRDRGGISDYSAGSYLSFLKLKQDNTAYEDLVKKIANHIEKPKNRGDLKNSYKTELAEAYIMGRFKDGTPVTLKDVDMESGNDANKDGLGMDDRAINDFNYKEFIASTNAKDKGTEFLNDDKAARCPFHSHIRKANPRSGYGQGGNHYELARRGTLYFMDKDEALDILKRFTDFEEMAVKSRTEIIKNKDEVGMLFMAFQNNLEQQFEAIVNQMHSNFTLDGISSGKDILTSKSDNWERKIPAEWNSKNATGIFKDKPLIHLRGGKYFFAPSISCLVNFNKKCYPFIPETVQKSVGNGGQPDNSNPVPKVFDMGTGGIKRRDIKFKMKQEKNG